MDVNVLYLRCNNSMKFASQNCDRYSELARREYSYSNEAQLWQNIENEFIAHIKLAHMLYLNSAH